MDSLDVGISIEELLEIQKNSKAVLVDARPKNEYLGQDDIWLRKGHIPGAISFHWARLMELENTHKFLDFKSAESGTSREGSLLRFYLKHIAKYPKVRLYEGSWKEYASLKHLPVETTELKKL